MLVFCGIAACKEKTVFCLKFSCFMHEMFVHVMYRRVYKLCFSLMHCTQVFSTLIETFLKQFKTKKNKTGVSHCTCCLPFYLTDTPLKIN